MGWVGRVLSGSDFCFLLARGSEGGSSGWEAIPDTLPIPSVDSESIMALPTQHGFPHCPEPIRTFQTQHGEVALTGSS